MPHRYALLSECPPRRSYSLEPPPAIHPRVMASTGFKRKASSSLEHDRSSIKQPRLNSTKPASTASKRLQLLDLPPEILLTIFRFTREPCLIHTCKALYQLLPAFVAYTKALLLLGFGAFSKQPDANGKGAKPLTLPGHPDKDWTRAERDELQLSAASSHFLRVSHLRQTHLALFRQLLREKLVDNTQFKLFEDDDEVMDLPNKLDCEFQKRASLEATVTLPDWDNEWV